MGEVTRIQATTKKAPGLKFDSTSPEILAGPVPREVDTVDTEVRER
jgi:hypothetical protein